MAAKDELGRRGEDIAAEYLQRQGLVVMSRNWRCAEGELDIVATDGISTVVFCEVKTRSGTGFGTPAEAVTRSKRRRIRRLANLWLAKGHAGWTNLQFDVIGIVIKGDAEPEIDHIREAF